MASFWKTLLFMSSWIALCFCDHDILTTIGFAASVRPESDSLSSVSLLPDTSTTIENSGKVFKFKYYSTSGGKQLRFQIWRSLDDGNSHLLLHQTQEVTTEGEGHYIYTCTAEEEFLVMPGDLIGVAIVNSSPLTYTEVDCVDISEPKTASGGFEEGDTTSFSSASSQCKQYSITAEVLYDTAEVVSMECTQLTAKDGFKNISSPGFDGVNFYDLDIHTCWQITVDPDLEERERFSVQIEILNFDFEDPFISGDCNADFLEIKDGGSVFSRVLNELCGSDFPETIDGTEQDVYMRMHTDDNELTVGTGFNLQYRVYEREEKKSVNVFLVVGIVLAIVLVAAVGIVLFFWCRLKKQRDREEKQKLKDNEVNGIPDSDDEVEKGYRSKRIRPKSSNKVSPDLLRREKSLYANPTSPTTKMVAEKDADLKAHIPKDERMPPPSQYQAPRKQKAKHWSKLGAGVQLQ